MSRAPHPASPDGRWNHNIHYGLRLLELIPEGATDALDIGCGEGWFVRCLADRVAHAVGLDPDGASLDAAREHGACPGVEFVLGDLLTADLRPGSFDFVTAVATLHHMDEEAGLVRMAELLRPGGRLAVVGLARSRLPRDIPRELAAGVGTRILKLTRTYWETPAPKVWPPPHTYGQIAAIARRVLPGSEFRRRLLWRYVLTWTKPLDA